MRRPVVGVIGNSYRIEDRFATQLVGERNLRAVAEVRERCGLDASLARALLEIYEESKAMAVFNRDSLASTLRTANFTTAAPADPSLDDHETFVDAEFHHRLAA